MRLLIYETPSHHFPNRKEFIPPALGHGLVAASSTPLTHGLHLSGPGGRIGACRWPSSRHGGTEARPDVFSQHELSSVLLYFTHAFG